MVVVVVVVVLGYGGIVQIYCKQSEANRILTKCSLPYHLPYVCSTCEKIIIAVMLPLQRIEPY